MDCRCRLSSAGYRVVRRNGSVIILFIITDCCQSNRFIGFRDEVIHELATGVRQVAVSVAISVFPAYHPTMLFGLV